MKKLSLTMFALIIMMQAFAEGKPTVSTPENEVWYLIQFMNDGNALTAESDGTQITISPATTDESRLWKVTGDDTEGYTFTNKKGYTLYVSSAAKNQMVYAASNPQGITKFHIETTSNGSYSEGFEIHPKGNTSISMNLWGGPGANRGVGLWDKGDINNPVQFNSAKQVEAMSKISLIPYPAQLEVSDDGNTNLGTFTAITYPDTEVQKYVTDFASQLAKTSGISLNVRESGTEATEGEIRLATEATLPTEGYTLTISEKNITIKAAAKAAPRQAVRRAVPQAVKKKKKTHSMKPLSSA